MGDWPNERGLSARHIRLACDASLRRMGTDWIDLYQMHHIDRDTSWDEIWEAMGTLRQQGKILYIGSSNFAGWHLATAQLTARERGTLGLVSEQSLYNLFKREIELEVIPAAQEYGIGILPWSPLLGGALGGILRSDVERHRRAEGRSADTLAIKRPQLEAYESLCEQLGHHPAQVGLAWLIAQPAVTAPIVGPRTLQQLEGAVAAAEVSLDDKALRRLDEIFPGRRTAPEDYAW
jgi:aryl-alcohol dehydrogenase-like predicted oxidoreductase